MHYDSIAGDSINQVEVPYRLVIKNYDKISGEAKGMAGDFVDFIHELAAEGYQLRFSMRLPGGEASDHESKTAVSMSWKLSLSNRSFKC